MRTSLSVFSTLFRRPKVTQSAGRWPMELPLLRFSERDEDTWTLKDAVTGVLVTGETGAGKCLAEGTQVLMYSGYIVPVESIKPGDLLMGDDGKPRQVLSTNRGNGRLYKITPTKGEPWACNDAHVMTIRHREKRERTPRETIDGKRVYVQGLPIIPRSKIVDVPLNEFLKQDVKDPCKLWKLIRTGVDWPENEKSAMLSADDFYFAGLWLGDGTNSRDAGLSFTNPDTEIKEWLSTYAKGKGWQYAEHLWKPQSSGLATIKLKVPRTSCIGDFKSLHPASVILRDFGYVDYCNKRIPHWASTAPKEKRLSLLAGLLDTDGHLQSGCFDIAQKYADVAYPICFIVRSLGLWSEVREIHNGCQTGAIGTYFRQSIAGETSDIPTLIKRKRASKRKQIKDVRSVGWSVEPCGVGDYYGFTLDGNGRFLLGDFTVTHNSSGPANLIARKFLTSGMGGLVLCYKSEESDIWVKRLKDAGRESDVRVFGIGYPYRYNFLDYESRTKAGGLDQIDNLVNLLRDIASVKRTAPVGNDASFWVPMQKLLIRNCLSLLMLAGEPLTLKAMNELIQSSPGSLRDTENKTWQERSYLYAMLEKSEKNHGTHPEFSAVEKFWMYTRANLPDKTRATIDAEFLGLADGPLSRGKLSELFGDGTNIDPTECFDGKVIIVNVPVEEYFEAGQYAALIWATAFMRATTRRSYKAPDDRPVFLFADEAQAFSTEKDAEYHAACRSKGVCVVRMTQNIPGWVKSYGGGPLAQITVDSILGNLVTKIFLQNSDPVTNAWASKMIAKDLEYKHSLSNSGGASSGGFNASASVSETFEPSCREEEFMNLKTGGPKNGSIVEGVIFQSGRLWLKNRRWCIRRFRQS